MKKKLVIIGLCAGLPAAVIVTVLILVRYPGRISYSGSIAAGVASKVVLSRDAGGATRITAKNMDDAFFGLGFLHGQDRYRNMVLLRSIAGGKSREALGGEGAILDRLSRAVGFPARARNMVQRLGAPYAGYLNAYARGVNAARAHRGENDRAQREWNAEDSVAILLLCEWTNAFLNNREIIFPFQREKYFFSLKDIFPAELVYYYGEGESECVSVIRKIKKLVKKHVGSFDRGFALYLPASRTRDRSAIAAFSFEDELSRYPGWYPVHLQVDGRLIKGITHAGMPFIFAGSNPDMSFFGFSAAIDIQDFVAETVGRFGESVLYLGSAGWSAFAEIDGGSPGGNQLHATENGPVLNDIVAAADYGETVVTVKSAFPGEDYIVSLFEIPLARGLDEAELRVRGINSYPRIYLFTSPDAASRAYSGMVPVRAKSDAVMRSGRDAEWTGMRDISVHRERSEEQLAAGSAFLTEAPDFLKQDSLRQDIRYDRLKFLMGRKARFTRKDVENLLMDSYSATAEMFLPIFLSILKDNPMASARLTRIYFQNWRCRMNGTFISPSVFHMLLLQFIRETYGDEFKESMDRLMENYDLMVPQFLEIARNGKSSFFDDRTTYNAEYRDTIFDRAFLKTMRFFNRKYGPVMHDWDWGSLHRGGFAIPSLPGERPQNQAAAESFSGGNDTLNLGTVDRDLRPDRVTSLTGYFGEDESFIFMNFSCSTDPRSEFYYGTQERVGAISFHGIYGKYFTNLLPKK